MLYNIHNYFKYYTNKAISSRKRTEEYKKVPTWYLHGTYLIGIDYNKIKIQEYLISKYSVLCCFKIFRIT